MLVAVLSFPSVEKREAEWVSDIERERGRGKVRVGAWPNWATVYSAFMACWITYGREMVLISIIALVFVLGEYEHSVSHQAAHPHAHTLHGYTQVRVHITAINVFCLPPTPPVVEPSCLSPNIHVKVHRGVLVFSLWSETRFILFKFRVHIPDISV